MSVVEALAAAVRSHRTGDLDQADRLYRDILNEDPQRAEALHGLGAVAYQKGECDRAIELVERAIELDSRNPVFYNTLGMAYRAKGKPEAAVANYRKGIAIEPQSATLQANLSRAWYDLLQCDRTAALTHLIQTARQFHRAGYLQQAEKLYRQLLDREPNHPDGLQGLGTLAYQQRQFDRAIAFLQQAIDRSPDNPSYHHNLGAAYQAQQNIAEAAACYRREIELDPSLEQPRQQLNTLLRQLRHSNLEAWKRELLQLAQLFQRQEDYKQAVYLYKKLLEGDSNNAEAHYGLGCIAYHHHQSYQAVLDLQKAVERDPQNATYQNALGLACELHGVPSKALEHFKKALELEPEREEIQENFNRIIDYFLNYYHYIGKWNYDLENYNTVAGYEFETGNFIKEHTGRIRTALRYYRRALVLRPEFPEVHHTLAELYLEEKNYVAAIDACRKAIQGKPDFAEAYKSLGNAFLGQQNGSAAMNAYQRAIAIKPDFAEVYSNIASLYFFQNQPQESLKLYQKALSIDNKIPGIHWNLGKVYERLGKVDETIQCWKQALDLDAEFGGGESYRLLANKYYGKGDKQTAIGFYKKAIALKSDLSEAYWSLCEIYNVHDQAAARDVSLKYCENTKGKDAVMASLAAIKAHLNSGVSDIAIAKFQEMEPQIYELLKGTLTYQDIVRLYLNIAFDMPHLRDDVPANAKLCKSLAQFYVKYLEAKSNAEKHKEIPLNLRSHPSHPLRIGFLSKHFRRHSVGWLSVDIMEELSKLTPHIFLYVTGDMGRDELTQRFETYAEKFSRPQGAQAKAILAEVAKDRLDVLVDMDSVTVMPNTEVFYHSPAHVCVSWLGFDAPYLTPKNYYLGDWQTHPAGVEEHYIEQVVRLPDSFAATRGLPIKAVDREVLRRSMRVAPNQVAFLCVATGNKFCPELVEAQIRILSQVPDSLLFYKGRVGDLVAIERIYKEECQRQGVRTNRIRVLPRTRTEEEHRLIYQFADVLIDSYPYSGATHVVEALWFNMPVVALVSQQSFGRQAYSLMKASGTDMGIAWTWDEYIDWSVRLGRDEGLRQQMRQQLERGKQTETLAPLWNPKKFASDMYGIFQELVAKQVSRG